MVKTYESSFSPFPNLDKIKVHFDKLNNTDLFFQFVVSIVFSPLCTELTTNWYQLHSGDYKGILEHSFGKQLPYVVLRQLS